MTSLALDTSVAVPLLLASHPDFESTTTWFGDRHASLSGHAVAETYSVLTRLRGDARVLPADAARLMEAAFDTPLVLRETTYVDLPQRLSRAGIRGGAVFDALVALAALENDAELATRDARSHATYAALGVQVVLVS